MSPPPRSRLPWNRWLALVLGLLVLSELGWLFDQQGRMEEGKAYVERMRRASYSSGARRGLRFVGHALEEEQILSSLVLQNRILWLEAFITGRGIPGDVATQLRVAISAHIGRLIRLNYLDSVGGFTGLEAREMLDTELLRRRRVLEVLLGEQAAELNATLDREWAIYNKPFDAKPPDPAAGQP